MPQPLPPELVTLLGAPDAAARERAWDEFLRAFGPLLLHVAASRGGGRDATMDRYALLLEKLRQDDCRRLRRFRADGEARFSTWLVLVARNLCVDAHRERFGRRAPDGNGAAAAWRETRRRLDGLDGNERLLVSLDSGDEPIDRTLERREAREALDAALARLDPHERLVLRLRFDDGASVPAIARTLGYPTPFHVYRLLDRILASLRSSLMRVGVDDPHA